MRFAVGGDVIARHDDARRNPKVTQARLQFPCVLFAGEARKPTIELFASLEPLGEGIEVRQILGRHIRFLGQQGCQRLPLRVGLDRQSDPAVIARARVTAPRRTA